MAREQSKRRTREPDADSESSAHGQVELAPGVRVRGESLRFQFSRSRGPGGQNVNKQNTRAELRVSVADIEGLDEHAAARLRRLAGRRLTAADEILITADTSRSQRANRKACIDRLSDLVERASRPVKSRKATRPSRAAIERRLELKRRRSTRKQDRRNIM